MDLENGLYATKRGSIELDQFMLLLQIEFRGLPLDHDMAKKFNRN
jgi:hypothetical protein